MPKQTKKNEILIELRDYLESFVKRFHNQNIHLLDISHHITLMKDYQTRLHECVISQEKGK